MPITLPKEPVVAALDEVWDRLDDLLAGLDDAAWATPTCLPGWDVKAVVAEMETAPEEDLDATCDAISHGSLMGARGNSGVILSQILRGLATTLKHGAEASGHKVAEALSAASVGAYQAVLRPIEGTILTVVRESAEAAKADLVSMSAHKMYGPKGVGALWVRRRPRVRIDPIIDGGGHERGMRSGTLAVPLIVGFGKAAELALAERDAEAVRLRALRDRLHRGIVSRLSEVYVNGSMEHRLPGNLNISFAYVEGEAMLMGLKEVAVSSGSACTSASLEPSYVLRALGRSDELAHSSIRFTIGRFTTEADVDYTIDLIKRKVEKLRELSPLWEMHQEGVDLSKIEWAAH